MNILFRKHNIKLRSIIENIFPLELKLMRWEKAIKFDNFPLADDGDGVQVLHIILMQLRSN